MQQSQRVEGNAALEHAVAIANSLRLPLVVGFGLTADYPSANARHYVFMLEGLRQVQRELQARGLGFVARLGQPDEVIASLAEDAAHVVWDKGYLRHQRAWRRSLVARLRQPIDEVDADCVVPVAVASSKAEYAARTIRPKILKLRPQYLYTAPALHPEHSAAALRFSDTLDLSNPSALVESLGIDSSVPAVSRMTGGLSEARNRLESFASEALPGYCENRNDPADPCASSMSAYLHFGQISAIEIALTIAGQHEASEADREAFLEQLIVRRELAINFVYYTAGYDTFDCLPDWARTTLAIHAADPRDPVYELEDLEAAATHDRYWNAAMREMRITGLMHNYMRMYWGKKIIEWTREPEEAFERTLYLNNKYFLDGRDANSFASVAWLFGMHDRPWQERAVFGKVRYMNDKGLRRKFDIERYVERMTRLESS